MTTFCGMNFTNKDLLQIVEIIERWSAGDNYFPVDCRKYSKTVLKYACTFNLLENKGKRVYISRRSDFNFSHECPIECLWMLMEKHVLTGDHHGFSIARSQGWKVLNIYPLSDRHDQTSEMIELLNKLMMYNFIYFQIGGSIWDIQKRKNRNE